MKVFLKATFYQFTEALLSLYDEIKNCIEKLDLIQLTHFQ